MPRITGTHARVHQRLASFFLDLIPILLLVKVVGVEQLFKVGPGMPPLAASTQIIFRVYLVYVVLSEIYFRLFTPVPGRTPGMRLLDLALVKTSGERPVNFFFGILHIIIGIFGFWLVWWPSFLGKPALHDMLFGVDVVRNPKPVEQSDSSA